MKLLLTLFVLLMPLTQAWAQDLETYSEQKTNILLSASQPEFNIKLKANPTTGYSWFLREYDPRYVITEKHEFKAPENKRLMGAPGFEIWTFKMTPEAFKVPSQTLLRFVYARPWDTQNQASNVVFVISTSDK